MIQSDLLAILPKLFENADIHDITIQRASMNHEENSAIKEYDILVNETLFHSQIQALDRILSDYDEIEMRFTADGMKILSVETNPRTVKAESAKAEQT